MCKKKFLIILILWCLPEFVYAANNLYYITQGVVEERLKEGIEYARYSIDMCIHDFAAVDIEKDLKAAKARGVKIRALVLESGTGNMMAPLSEALIRKGFDVRVLKVPHNGNLVRDFFILDNRIAITGVYNWLAYRNRAICNDVIFSHDTKSIHDYKNLFYRLFAEGEAVPLLAYQAKQGIKVTSPMPEGISTIPDKTQPDETQTVRDYPVDEDISIPEKPTKPADEKFEDFIDISFEELDKQFGKKSALTSSEKNKLWEKYKGKYVRWRGVVSYKGMGRVDWNRIGISQRNNNKDAEVEILLDWKKFDKVMDLRVRSTITYTGKLVSYPRLSAPYRLSDGDFELHR